MNVLDVKNLSLTLNIDEKKQLLVNDVGFSIARGETFCLVGESGSGKSLTALSIMRLLPSDIKLSAKSKIFYRKSGNSRAIDLTTVDDEKYRGWRGSKIAMIFQEPMSSLNPVMTIGEQLAEAVMHADPLLEHQELQGKVIQLLTDVNIPEADRRISEYPHRLSGGQRQRVMIAMALAGNPELLIADEPTTALDVTIQAGILKLLKSLQRERQMALMFITHDLGIVANIADRVAVMRNGQMVESGTVRQIILQPESPYTRSLLQSLPENLLRVETPSPETPNPDCEEPLLFLEELCVDFNSRRSLLRKRQPVFRAVDKVTLTVKRGEILSLVGESGCGKTTLGRTILRLLRPTSGKILFNGKAIQQASSKELKQIRAKMQIVFQDSVSALNPRLTLAGTMIEPMKVHGIESSYHSRLELAAEILREVRLDPDLLSRYPHQLSGGQRQRVGIARSLVLNPDFIVCDEVTSALDVSVQARVLELLLRLREERRLSLLFITHDIGVVEYISDRTAVMFNGKIVESGDTHQICVEPQNEYTQRLISAVPRVSF